VGTPSMLPMPPITPARMTHELLPRLLKLIDGAARKDLRLHLVDSYATHKTPETHMWLLRHRRFYIHFTPPARHG
jgi:hypothetical protein